MQVSNFKNSYIYFGSSYKFSITSKNYEAANSALDTLYEKEGQDFHIYEKWSDSETLRNYGIINETNVAAADEYDDFIESVLLQRNIKFVKQTQQDNLNLDNIYSRIKFPKDSSSSNTVLVDLDVEKIEKLFRECDTYISPDGKKGAIGRRYEQFKEYLKTGQDIDASKIILTEFNGKAYLSFIDGRHRFSVMRDMGMKKIPFAMDNKSLEAAVKCGLVVNS